VPEDEKKEFLDQYHWADGVSAETKKEFMKGYRNVQLFLKKFVAAGGKLYSGTDSASANVPGLSLHHEMEIYVDAGIPPIQALQSSTLWAAEMARLDGKLGSVVQGKYGDVVILDADPLQDIHNTQLVSKVIKGGVLQDIAFHQGYNTPFHIFGQGTKHLYAQPPVVSNLTPGVIKQGDDLWVKVQGDSIVILGDVHLDTKFVGDGELNARVPPRRRPGWAITKWACSPRPGGGTTKV
jgi:hypothetical protein